jgi:hypothetical protein
MRETPARHGTNGRVVASNKITAPEGTHVIIWLNGTVGAGDHVTVAGPFDRRPEPRMTQGALAAVRVSQAW